MTHRCRETGNRSPIGRAAVACAFLVCAILAASPALGQRSTPVQVLHPSGAPADEFGRTVAIDGDTMVVGAALDDVGGAADRGSAHVYRWTGSGWSHEATLVGADGGAGDLFGGSVAIEGNTIAVGAPARRKIYVFTRSGTVWTEQQALSVAGGPGDGFGASVALSAGMIVAGAALDDVGSNADQGSAYVFAQTGNIWVQQQQITAFDGASNDQFGSAVATSGERLLIGAVGDDSGRGSAYVFVRFMGDWIADAKLVAPDGTAGDAFGVAVAIEGSTAVVGAHLDDEGAFVNAGSAYTFTRGVSVWSAGTRRVANDPQSGALVGRSVAISDGTFVAGGSERAYVFTSSGQQRKLTAADAGIDDFGACVDIDGGVCVVGAPLDGVGSNPTQGSAWAFTRVHFGNGAEDHLWLRSDARLLASDGTAGDVFGLSVAVSGNTAVVGAYREQIGSAQDQGAAYVFERSGSQWVQTAKLTAADGEANDRFGTSVAIEGDTVVVGAFDDDFGSSVNQGSAYVFTRTGTAWTQRAKLSAFDGESNDSFGISVAISGDTIVVGAYGDNVGSNPDQGSAYVFVGSGATWTLQTQLTTPPAHAGVADNFGVSVSLSRSGTVTRVLIGAYSDDVGANVDQGAAYVWFRTGTTWAFEQQITASDGAPGDRFGLSVSLSANAAIIGAYLDDVGTNVDQGSAYVFTRSPTNWTQHSRLVAADGAAGDLFGIDVAIAGSLALVGASAGDAGAIADQGTAYVFGLANGVWVQCEELAHPAVLPADRFGISVAMDGTTAIVGADLSDIGGATNRGAAYCFDVPFDDFPVVWTTGQSVFDNLPAAIAAATGNQTVNSTSAAFRLAPPVVDTGPTHTLGFSSSFGVRVPRSSSVTLRNGSDLFTAASGASIEIYGALHCSFQTSIDVGRRFHLAPGSTFTSTGTFILSGPFDCAIDQSARFNMLASTLRMADVESTVEVMSRDIGPTHLGFDRSMERAFPIGTVLVVPGTAIRLVDVHDNDGLGQASPEAMYLHTLSISANGRLINPGHRIYCRELLLTPGGTIDVPANVIVIGCGTGDCAAATPLPLDGTPVDGTNASSACATLPGTVRAVDGPSAWYTFTGTGNDVTISTCHSATSLNTVLHVYCAPSGCDGPFNRVGGNDDDPAPCASSPGASTVSVATIPGMTYFVVVNGLAANQAPASGPFAISATQGPPSAAALGGPTRDRSGAPAQITENEACRADSGVGVNGTCALATAYPALDLIAGGSVATTLFSQVRDIDFWRLPPTVAGTAVSLHLRSENPVIVRVLNDSGGTCADVSTTALIEPCADLNTAHFTLTLPATGSSYLFITTPSFGGSPCSLGLDEYRFKVALPCTPPAIAAPTPPMQTACSGSSVTFTASTPSGSLPITLQWNRNGMALPSETGPTLTVNPVRQADAGSYTVTATNACGSATSDPAILTLFCPADFNCSGAASVQDIFDFLAAYFGGDPRADFNASGVISVQDIFDFLAAYFAGCS